MQIRVLTFCYYLNLPPTTKILVRHHAIYHANQRQGEALLETAIYSLSPVEHYIQFQHSVSTSRNFELFSHPFASDRTAQPHLIEDV